MFTTMFTLHYVYPASTAQMFKAGVLLSHNPGYYLTPQQTILTPTCKSGVDLASLLAAPNSIIVTVVQALLSVVEWHG